MYPRVKPALVLVLNLKGQVFDWQGDYRDATPYDACL
jgi:hypothetical protein